MGMPGLLEYRDIVPGRIRYYPKFITEDTDALRKAITETSTWTQEHIRFSGKPVPLPRLVGWHGAPGVYYRYSGINHPANPWTPALLNIRDMLLNTAVYPEGIVPNGVLLNWYRSGTDSIGKHSDTEVDLVPGSPIVGLSLGVTRIMTIASRPDAGTPPLPLIKLPLEDGSLLVMYNDCQKAFTHEIKKEPKVIGERISLTFRVVKNDHKR